MTDAVPDGQLRVTDDGVRLRAEPSTSATVLTELSAGTFVTPVSPYGWREVDAGARSGWIATSFLADADGQLRVTENNVRLRTDPSTSATVLTELSAGTLVTPTSPFGWREVD